MELLSGRTAVFQQSTVLNFPRRIASCRRGRVTLGAAENLTAVKNAKGTAGVGDPVLEKNANNKPLEIEKREPEAARQLPWAVEFEARTTQREATGAFGESRANQSGVQDCSNSDDEKVQLSVEEGGGRPPKQSARQRLIAIDRERGEEVVSLSKRPPDWDRRLGRRHFQRGEKANLKEEARLVRTAVDVIMMSQSYGGRTDAMTLEMPKDTESPQKVGPGCEEVSEFGANGSLKAKGTEEGTVASNIQPGEKMQALDQKAAELLADADLKDDQSGRHGLSVEKQAALARTLEALAGSLSLFRWQDVLQDLGEHGQWALALDVFTWMQANLRLKPNAFTYSQMATILQAAGQLSPLIALYHNALHHDIAPPVQLYNAAIYAHCQQGAVEKGLEIFAVMKEAGCKPEQWTYACLLRGCAKSILKGGAKVMPISHNGSKSEVDDSFRLQGGEDILLSEESETFEDDLEVEGADDFMGPQESSSGLGVSESTLDYAAISTVGGNQKQTPGENAMKKLNQRTEGETRMSWSDRESRSTVELADSLVAEMLASGVQHSLVTLTPLAEVYARGGHVARAIEFLARMSDDFGVNPDANCFVTLLYACAEGGGTLRQLLKVYRGMTKEGIKPPAGIFHPLMKACAEERNLSVAYELFANISRFGGGPDVKQYTSLVYVCGVVGDLHRAEDLLDEMVNRGLQPTAVTWNVLLSALQKGGASFVELKPVLDRMRASTCDLDCMTYSTLLRACKEEGRVNTAQRIYTEFLDQVNVAGSRAHVHLEAMDTFARAGMVDACEAITAQMRAEGLGFTKRAHEVLIGAYAAVLNYPMMAKSLKAMLDEGLAPGPMANGHLAKALAKGGRVDELLVLLESIREGGDEVPARMWHHVIRAYLNVPDQVPDYAGLSQTLLDLPQTVSPLLFEALVRLLVLVSQADTWQAVEPLILLLSQHNDPLFCTANVLLTGVAESQSSVNLERGKLVTFQEQIAGQEQISDGGEPLDLASIAHEFVRVAQASQANQRLRLILFGRMANALWFRGLRNRAAVLVRTILTQELNRPVHAHLNPDSSAQPSKLERKSNPKPLQTYWQRNSELWRIDLHNLSEGGACALLLSWLQIRQADVRRGRGDPPRRVEIITGWGKHTLVGGKAAGLSSVQDAVADTLRVLGAPFKVSTANEGALVASSESVREWLHSCPLIELKDEKV